jgi:hypothetical protein
MGARGVRPRACASLLAGRGTGAARGREDLALLSFEPRTRGRGVVRAAIAIAVGWGALTRAGLACADEPVHASAALEYVTPEGASCPDRTAFASSVATRLGYDPFDGAGDQKKALRVRLRRERSKMIADLHVEGAAGEPADKTLTSEQGACDELAAASALAAALLLDPRAMFPKPPPKPAPATGPSLDSRSPGTWPWYEPPPLPHERPQPPPEPEPDPARVHLGVSALGCVGCAPAVSSGASVFAGLSRGRFGVELGGRADLPTSATSPAGREVSSSLVLGELFPHLRLGLLRPGLLGAAGALFGNSGGDRQVSTWAAAGARVAVELPVGDTFFLRGALDGLFVLNRVSLRVDGAELWSTPAFVSTLGLGAGVRL